MRVHFCVIGIYVCMILLELWIFQDYLDIDMAQHQNLSLQSHLLHINAGYKTNSTFPLPSEAMFSSLFLYVAKSLAESKLPAKLLSKTAKRTSHLPDSVYYAFVPCWFGFALLMSQKSTAYHIMPFCASSHGSCWIKLLKLLYRLI